MGEEEPPASLPEVELAAPSAPTRQQTVRAMAEDMGTSTAAPADTKKRPVANGGGPGRLTGKRVHPPALLPRLLHALRRVEF